MHSIALGLFCFALAWVVYVYAGYPCLVWILGRFHPFVHCPQDGYSPKVSVLIAAHNEAKDIAWKIEETLAWDWPEGHLEVLVASDASEDGTDEILRQVNDSRVRFVRLEHRVGKNEALNRLASLASGELFLFTDANTHIDRGCLRDLSRHFADPRVGCITGVERTIDRSEMAVAAGSKVYLDYEARITSWESRLGSVLVCDGSIFCILSQLFRPLQPDLANDLELPIRIGHEGRAVLFEAKARSTEKVTSSLRQEFRRRRRICAQGALGAWRLRGFLGGLRGWQFASRKILRWLSVIPLALFLGSTVALMHQTIFAVLLFLQLCFCALAAIGAWRAARAKSTPTLLALPFYFALANLAAFVGVVESCLGRRFGVWDIPTLSRGREEVA